MTSGRGRASNTTKANGKPAPPAAPGKGVNGTGAVTNVPTPPPSVVKPASGLAPGELLLLIHKKSNKYCINFCVFFLYLDILILLN